MTIPMTIRTNRRAMRIAASALALPLVLGLGACGALMRMHGGGRERPADAEFGFGPRVSQAGLYTVTLEPEQTLVTRKLQKVRVRVLCGDRPVERARIAIDGGMPEHGHGLPTQPRVSRSLGEGVYEIEGVRFSMGGWWELKLAIAADAGIDAVTFNLDL